MLPCIALLAFLLPGQCAAKKDFLPRYVAAMQLAPAVDRAIQITNKLLQHANAPGRLRSSWSNDVGPKNTDIVVYLVKSPAAVASREALLRGAEDLTRRIKAAEFSVDPAFENCTEIDDCVARQFPENDIARAIELLNSVNSLEIAKTAKECRCIALIETELEYMDKIFGADWDAFILALRFNSESELRNAVAEGRVPDVLLDGEPMQIESLIALILLHEVGHISSFQLFGNRGAKEDVEIQSRMITRSNREELRADAFAADVLRRACIPTLDESAKSACLANATVSMLIFALGVTGKSNIARCVRYLDSSSSHPNYQLRSLFRDYLLRPGALSRKMLMDFLDTRDALRSRPWVQQLEECRRRVNF